MKPTSHCFYHFFFHISGDAALVTRKKEEWVLSHQEKELSNCQEEELSDYLEEDRANTVPDKHKPGCNSERAAKRKCKDDKVTCMVQCKLFKHGGFCMCKHLSTSANFFV